MAPRPMREPGRALLAAPKHSRRSNPQLDRLPGALGLENEPCQVRSLDATPQDGAIFGMDCSIARTPGFTVSGFLSRRYHPGGCKSP